jgi:stage II sporulation protein D
MKKTAALLLAFALVILLIPTVVVYPFIHKATVHPATLQLTQIAPVKASAPAVTVSVRRSATGTTERVALNQYLIGVVGSEMPAAFLPQALEAQALAARTYIMARLIHNPAASVTDTVSNQVYNSPQELKRIWGKDYQWRIDKITKAVAATDNQVITYQGKLITPLFFSTSNGRTANASDYWTSTVPYLKSVPSPWDKLSPKYKMEKVIRASEVSAALGVTLPAADGPAGSVISRTGAGYIAQYKIGGQTFTGRQIREKLSLSSSDFRLTRKGNTIIADTLGNGHGVGMSQYGAQGMARTGKTARQIITYYYQGTAVSQMTVTPGKTTVMR